MLSSTLHPREQCAILSQGKILKLKINEKRYVECEHMTSLFKTEVLRKIGK